MQRFGRWAIPIVCSMPTIIAWNEDGKDNRPIAVVTGAAGVLGKATSKLLIQEGYRIVAIDVDKKRLERLKEELGEGSWIPVAVDVSDYEAVKKEYERIREEVGTPDVLVNNAGILSNNKIESTSVEEWKRVMDININGAFYLTKCILPDMKARRYGRIINTTSLAAKVGGVTAGTAYCCSKGALQSLTFSVAREVASFGITVNAISPAYVRTPMVMDQLSPEERDRVCSLIPVGRFCEPEEFAAIVLLLIRTGYITGEIIDLNGGLYPD